MSLSAEHDCWLREHRWSLLATVRLDGRPQVSMVAYHWDGSDAVISCRTSTAKWHNAQRCPSVVLVVAESRQYVAVQGRAECVSDDPDRARLTMRLLGSLLAPDAALLRADVDRGLDVSGRVVIRVVPSHATGRI